MLFSFWTPSIVPLIAKICAYHPELWRKLKQFSFSLENSKMQTVLNLKMFNAFFLEKSNCAIGIFWKTNLFLYFSCATQKYATTFGYECHSFCFVFGKIVVANITSICGRLLADAMILVSAPRASHLSANHFWLISDM